MTDREEYSKLGGWLLLLAIGIVSNPLKLALAVFTMLPELLSEEALGLFSDPTSEFYAPMYLPLAIFEIVGNVGLALTSMLLVHLFFSKKSSFPRLFILFILANLFYLLIDLGFTKIVFPQVDIMHRDVLLPIVTGVLICAIWIPYMLRSERVKYTFGYKVDDRELVEFDEETQRMHEVTLYSDEQGSKKQFESKNDSNN